MNWRASLVGALIVALAGLGVGVGVGGKKTVESKTVTVVRTLTTAAQPTTTDGTTSTSTSPATTAETPTPPRGGRQQYLADYIESQGADRLNAEASNASLNSDAATLQLKGKTTQHAVAFDLYNGSSDTTETFQMPVAGFSHLSSSSVGIDTLGSASTYYRLTIYKDHSDTPNAPALFEATFHGPSETHKMDFDTRGATDLVFVWTEKSSGEPDDSNTFILADPILTE